MNWFVFEKKNIYRMMQLFFFSELSFFLKKLAFTPCKAKHPLRGMEL